MSGSILLIVVYIAIAVFLTVFVYRTVKIARMPIHLRWELAPVPHEKGKDSYGGSYLENYEWWTKPRETSEINGIIYMMKEIFLLRGVWENNRGLWPYSFAFHSGIYLLVVMAFLLALASIAMIFSMSMAITGFLLGAASVPAAAGYMLGCAGTAGLVVKRAVDPDLRPFNTISTYLNLLLLFAMFATGCFAFFMVRDFSIELGFVITSIITAHPSSFIPPAVAVHVCTAALFIAWLPFTHMIHFMAKYFTYHEVRWNDRPQDEKSEQEVKTLLSQKLSWSAPHINGDNKKTWLDAATEENNNE